MDDLTKKRPQDASKINLNQQHEVNWWCDELNCSKSRLAEAVKQVGVSVEKVKEFLKKK